MDLPQVLSRLAESAAIALRAEAASVYLLDDSGALLSVAAVHGLPDEWLDRAPQDIQGCVLDREALTSRSRAVIADDSRLAL